jgi:putative DNA primase/helicase
MSDDKSIEVPATVASGSEKNQTNSPVVSASNASTGANSNAIITVVRDPEHHLGKRFDKNADRTVSKKSSVNLAFGIAIQYHVPTHADLAKLLADVGNDPRAAIINASFDGIEVGEEFAILSEREIEKRLGIPASDRARQNGAHQIEYNGKQIKAVGRFKDNTRPSNWQLLDRDIDEHTPGQFRNLTTPQWLKRMSAIIPGVDEVSYVETPSTSSRVLLDGKAVGAGNGHVWVKSDDPSDIERARPAIMVRAAQAGMTWLKPRYSKSEEGKMVGNGLTTILDPSVWTVGRLVFDGKPTVSDGLTVSPLVPVIHTGERDSLNTAAMTIPDAKTVREITRKAGVEMDVRAGSNGLRIVANDLTLDTEIETKDHGVITIREMVERKIEGKVRCQAPFRASESWAAFYNTNADGIPFIYDNGTGTTHWLNQFETEEVKLIPVKAVISELLPKVKEDGAVALEKPMVEALAAIQQADPAEYQRQRAALKATNKVVSLGAVDRTVKACMAEISNVETHHGYAKTSLAELTEGEWFPVGHQGGLYVVDPATGLWDHKPVEALIRLVAERHDAKEHCARSSDYKAIAEHMVSLATDAHFFSDAPNGLACTGGFYEIVGGEIKLVPLTPAHRQRVMLDFTPVDMPTPEFDKFLHETFQSPHEGEEAQQIQLLQEITGAIMLGILHKFQFAVLFYEPFGRAGKGTLEKQIRALVPKDFVSAISPFKWHHDYHVATLAGKRLNVVGELPENEPIPASSVKSVIGGDLVTGRHPTHRPITFANEAAHLFMSNHMITTKDQSEAFFARWKIFEFPNSRLKSGLPLDENLAQRIIHNELPGIAWWALEGAARLLRNGKFSASTAHDRLMAKWRRSTNTLEEFIHEACILSIDCQYRRSTLYKDYADWCSETGRKPFSKGRVKELLEHNLGMGIRLVELDGYETFVGIKQKPAKPTQMRTSARKVVASVAANPVISADGQAYPTDSDAEDLL